MKRALRLILTVSVIFFFAGTASAFDENDLVAVVYNENDIEVVINLGDISGIKFTASNVQLAGTGSVNLSQFGQGIGWDNLSLGIFGGTQTGGSGSEWHAWFATTKATISGISTSKLTNFMSGIASVYTYWGDGNTFSGSAKAVNSYDMKLNSGSNAPGSYAGVNNTDTAYGEADLAALNSAGYVDMYLYHYKWADLDKGNDVNTDYTAVIRFFLDGSIKLNPRDTKAKPMPWLQLLLEDN